MKQATFVVSIAAAVLSLGSGYASAQPANDPPVPPAQTQTQPPAEMPLSITGPTGCPNDGIVIGQGRAPSTDTGRFTLEVWDADLEMWQPLQTQDREPGYIVNLRPNPGEFALGEGETALLRISTPPDRDAQDDGALPTVLVGPMAVTAPVCA